MSLSPQTSSSRFNPLAPASFSHQRKASVNEWESCVLAPSASCREEHSDLTFSIRIQRPSETPGQSGCPCGLDRRPTAMVQSFRGAYAGVAQPSLHRTVPGLTVGFCFGRRAVSRSCHGRARYQIASLEPQGTRLRPLRFCSQITQRWPSDGLIRHRTALLFLISSCLSVA